MIYELLCLASPIAFLKLVLSSAFMETYIKFLNKLHCNFSKINLLCILSKSNKFSFWEVSSSGNHKEGHSSKPFWNN